MTRFSALFTLTIFLLACRLADLPVAGSRATSLPTPTLVPVKFSSPTPTMASSSTPTLLPSSTPTVMAPTPTSPATFTPSPASPTVTTSPAPPSATPEPAVVPAEPANLPEPATPDPTVLPDQTTGSEVDFLFRRVRLRTNAENSWDGTLGPGECGSDHSIYVYVADAQENLLNDILVGDKYGNFEVPTGADGPGMVRILVWSATMELAVTGHQDGTRYTSEFTPPLSTLDEEIPLDWLEEAGYCQSPEDCQQRVASNQLCRGHYSYDVIFQRSY